MTDDAGILMPTAVSGDARLICQVVMVTDLQPALST